MIISSFKCIETYLHSFKYDYIGIIPLSINLIVIISFVFSIKLLHYDTVKSSGIYNYFQ